MSYKVTYAYDLRRYPDLSTKLGILEVGTIVEGWAWDSTVFRVTHVNGALKDGYFPRMYLDEIMVEPTPPEKVIRQAVLNITFDDGTTITETLIPQ